MDNQIKKCEECGELLKPSQYARVIKEGDEAVKDIENLACRNYPNCKKAEKEII